MRSGRPLSACVLLLLLAPPISAVVERDSGRQDPRWIDPPAASGRSERLDLDEANPAARAARAFVARRGGQWRFSADPRTGLATLVQGSGVPTVPGRGNALGAEALAGLPLPDGEIDLETLEPLARAFIATHRDLVAPRNGRLELDRKTSGPRDGGRLFSLHFRWYVDDVRVERARVFIRLNSGNVTQFGAPLVGRAEVDTSPAFDGTEAVGRLLAWSGDDETARLHDVPELLIQPEDDGPNGLVYRLVWVVRYRVPGRIETWEGRLDARTGEVIGFRDVNAYGRVRGGIYPRTVTDAEVSTAMPFASIVGETTLNTDVAGSFIYGGGEFSSGLDGQFFSTNCEACSNPSQATLSGSVGIGLVDFGLGGVDEIANGLSTPAERNGFYHMNQIRRLAKKWLSIGWLDSNVGVNVNIADTCNAVWNGSANFFRSGGGCNNTGEISDVMYHEWGHGLDGNTNIDGDGATGEGTADVVSVHLTHSPLIGPYFRTDGSPVRDIDKDTTAKGLITRSNIGGKCPTGSGPLGYEVHCEGEIYGQASWDLSQALVAKHGQHTGWRTSERIFFTALPDSVSYLPDQTEPIYDAYLNADDDDGNLANGTPNGQEIFDAFDLHEIAGSSAGSSTPCTRPSQPTLSATPDCDRVDLSWTSVAGVDHYAVFRSEILEDRAYFHVADVASSLTTFTDTEVAPGVDYFYVVMAVNPDGCESTVESPVQTALVSQPILSVTAAVSTDEPRGNRSGFADPGEEVDLIVTLGNFGDADSGSIAGTLTSSTPGVTILNGSDTWPALTVGSQANNEGILRFETDDLQLECGDTVRFRVAPDGGPGCPSENSLLDVVLGDRADVFVDDFETDQGWSLDTVNSTATNGDWIRGDPDGTTYQPEDDVSDPGTQCWFTATNPGGIGADDVDDGVTILVSPVIDLSGMDRAMLSYYRWFANRDLGEDSGDFFKADVSDNAGGSWVNLETLGTNESAASWTRREFNLEAVITLTSQVQLRFQVADGTATGNLIEAAVDDIRIEEPVCDDTPACFVEPTFSGVQTAQPGTSCAETDLSWQAASSNCINATITYNVYRSTDPAFVPDTANRVATGVTGTQFSDSLLDPGVTYHYVVRAFDSRSGEDSNLARQAVTAPTSPDIEPPIFGGLGTVASGDNCGEIDLGWSVAQETCSAPVIYRVYRSTDPGFVPGPANLIGSTFAPGFADAALSPGASYTYLVRAVDEASNEDLNDARFTLNATILDKTLLEIDFEPNDGGWSVVAPDDAVRGNWEWGDPEGTGTQPEDDTTPDPGVNAWITGLSATLPGGDNNDIDDGTTTLLSARYDLSSAVDPVASYSRWFTNDQGAAPGEDDFDIEVSNDDGSNWNLLEQVGAGTPLAWVDVEIPLTGITTPTADMRFRFTARDVTNGSLVEAGIDDFALVDRDRGCLGCPTPVQEVSTIFVDRSGGDMVLDWSADPVSAPRYVVYELSGSTFDVAVRVGTTEGKTFVHESAAASSGDFYYRVTAIDACANESPLP